MNPKLLVFAAFSVMLISSCGIARTPSDKANSPTESPPKVVYIYPPPGEDDTAIATKATADDPVGASVGIRSPQSGTKAEIIGPGPTKDGTTKQVRILEGEFKQLEGWVPSICLLAEKKVESVPQTIKGTETVKWLFKSNGKIDSTASIENSTVFFGSGDRLVYSLSCDSGAKIWDLNLNSGIMSGCTTSNRRLYFGTKDGIFFALDAKTGNLAWKWKSPKVGIFSGIPTKPLVIEDKVIFGSLTGDIRALNRNSGKLVWSFKTRAEANSAPVSFGSSILFGSRDGCLYCVDLCSGNEKWKFETGGTINASPTLKNGIAYFSARGYDPSSINIYAVDVNAGKQIWHFNVPLENGGWFQPQIFQDRVIFSAEGYGEKKNEHYLYALKASDGSRLWKRFIPAATTDFVPYKNGLAFGGKQGFYIVSGKSGELLFSQKCGQVLSIPTISNQTAYFGSDDRNFYSVKLPSNLVPVSDTVLYPMIDNGVSPTLAQQQNKPTYSYQQDTTHTPLPSDSSSLNVAKLPLAIKSDNEVKRLREENLHLQEKLFDLRQQISTLEYNQDLDDLLLKEERKKVALLNTRLDQALYKSQNTKSHSEIAQAGDNFSRSPKETLWPNIPDFMPQRYKEDVARRLHKNSDYLGDTNLENSVNISFEITRDGRPINIHIINAHEFHTETLKRIVNFIELSGPFRPLLTAQIDYLCVNIAIKKNEDTNCSLLNSLEISALGNRL